MNISITRATPDDAATLSDIAWRSKQHWGYSPEQMAGWREALTISEDMIRQHDVYLLHVDDKPMGMYMLWQKAEGHLELEHLWLLPETIGKGLGRKIWQHILQTAHQHNASMITVVSDPNAKGFYQHMGAVQIGEYHAEETGRVLPILQINI